jgi:hypothetical protein
MRGRYFARAVGIHTLTINHPHLYRPQENPANHYIHDGAGDAVDITIAYDGDYWRSGS